MSYLIGQKIWLVRPIVFVENVCAVSISFIAVVAAVATQKSGYTLSKDEEGRVYSFGGRNWSDYGRMPDILGGLGEQQERRIFSDALNIYNGIEGDFDPGLKEPIQFVGEDRRLITPTVEICFCLKHKNAFYFNGDKGHCSSCRQKEIREARLSAQERARAKVAA